MAWGLVEAIVDEIIQHFKDDLRAKLKTLDAEYKDGIILAEPRAIRMTDPEAPASGISIMAPELFVIGAETNFELWRQTTVMSTHAIVIWLMAQDADREILRKRVYRYGRALFEVLVAGHFDSSITWNMIDPISISYSPIMAREHESLADVRILANFTKQETA